MTIVDTKQREFIRYLFASVIALLIDYSTLYSLTEFLSLHYLLSACLAFAAGLVAIYLLSVTWVFGTRKLENPALEFLIFLGIGMAGLVLNALIMFVATGWIGMHYLVSKATSTGFVFLFNYFLRSSLLFNKKPSAQPNHIT